MVLVRASTLVFTVVWPLVEVKLVAQLYLYLA
ncbi:hypothetical protein BD749_0015 [Pontibacter ramchanderi]|uniref:Uncharacterized protein n=1 Tax=Pontibacter ramchanderi TaxID=1179743 RepID=A0A2N3V0D6_9BACT|nr:hypothetical protein BD749_0015 [Pontibacter ramchanderi]